MWCKPNVFNDLFHIHSLFLSFPPQVGTILQSLSNCSFLLIDLDSY